jgi:peptidoglycan/LPS O-acetylase OafA/YrhL
VHKATFRKDINGLRAVAVIAVILYHFGISGFGGGFIGVDVFFVISGYLMTEIITSRINRESFKLSEFYLSRAKRILPALIALCIILLVLGWFYLPPAELKELSKQIKSSILFYSNQQFMSDAGYFDTSSHEKWLLHTWSLSVEWQFYLIYPLLILVTSKLFKNRNSIIYTLAMLAIASYVFSSMQAESNSALNFYSIGTRAWEMAVGGLICLLPAKKTSEISRYCMGLVGLAIVVISAIALKGSGKWPGISTLAPVLGCALVIWASSSLWLLENRIIQWFGKVSYSLYLWHWPVVVALVYFQLLDESEWVLTGIALTLVFGAISYSLFEKAPQHKLNKTRPIKSFASLLVGMVLIIGVSQAFKNNSLPRKTPEIIAVAENEAGNMNPRRRECMISSGIASPSCNYGGTGEVAAIVMGDSHANAAVTAVVEALPDKNLKVQEWSYASCPTIFGLNLVVNDRQCREFNEWASEKLSELDKKIPVIIVNRSSSYPMGDEGSPTHAKGAPYIYFSRPYNTPTPEFLAEYKEHYINTICEIAKDRKVFLVRPFPEMPLNVPKLLSRKLMISENAGVMISMDSYKKRHAFVLSVQDTAAKDCGAVVLDSPSYLCDSEYCYGSKSGRPFYYDASHLSEFGNRRLIPMFETIFNADQG